ncbi:hypothetical protein CHISP_3651 [Chitinispirillum alkaliphilum]|nr:hypothetical protein CHISP_3651 [Chitinispirillum alkaliphilum]
MKIFIAFTILFLGACSPSIKTNRYKESNWYQYYSTNQLEIAEEKLSREIEKYPGDPTLLTYYAETLQRLRKFSQAREFAHKALSFDKCNSHALTILSAIHNTQYGENEYSNSDSSTYYMFKAVECDDFYGTAWEFIWIHSIIEGDSSLEKKAASQLYHYYSRPHIEFARWLLAHLPPNAILITSGDLDTYPLVALQQAENFRPDVVVVNSSLLNLRPYYKTKSEKVGIPVSEYSKQFTHTREKIISEQILDIWLQMAQTGEMNRPLRFAVTTDRRHRPLNYECVGPYLIPLSHPSEFRFGNPERMWASLKDINPESIPGQMVYEKLTSPILLGPLKTIDFNTLYLHTAKRTIKEFAMAQNFTMAEEVLSWKRKLIDASTFRESLYEEHAHFFEVIESYISEESK